MFTLRAWWRDRVRLRWSERGTGKGTHMARGRTAPLTGALCVLAAVALACVPPPSGGGSSTTTTTTTTDVPSAPTISSFTVRGTPGKAPALVALAWSVADPNGDPLTCRIDGDGDGVFEVVVENCPQSGSRNVVVPTQGTVTARLQVDDGVFAPVEATRSFSVGADPIESLDIELRGIDSLGPAETAAFTAAKQRWESIIVRGVPATTAPPRPPCLPASSPDLPGTIDDLIIDVAVVPIDGPGGVLAEAGPTCVNLSTELPVHGIMRFDSADVATLLANGQFELVVLHEMAHVLGFGTVWDMTSFVGGSRKVISGAGTSNPRYSGGRGVAEYSLLGQSGNVPLENLGGPGTADAHWRETTFGNELMTGFLNPGANPLSRLSIASMVDLGYQVDVDQADPYSLPGSAAALRQQAPLELVVQRPDAGAL